MLSRKVKGTTKAVLHRAVVTTAATILYAGLTTRLLCEHRYPQAQVYVDNVICHGVHDHGISYQMAKDRSLPKRGVGGEGNPGQRRGKAEIAVAEVAA